MRQQYAQRLCAYCLEPFQPSTHKQITCCKSHGAKLRWIKQHRVELTKKELERDGTEQYVDKRWRANNPRTDQAISRLVKVLASAPLVEQHRVDRAARNARIPKKFTDRMQDVLLLAARGFTQKEIADRLGIGVETVKGYQNSILVYFHANTITQAVAIAQKMDIVPTPTLTENDRELLTLIAVGKHDKEIALVTNRTQTNVRERVKRLLRKFGVRNRTAMVSRAIDLGIL